jgi:hypothetical protein
MRVMLWIFLGNQIQKCWHRITTWPRWD